jgi:putative transposase
MIKIVNNLGMQLTIKIKLLPNTSQKDVLLRTFTAFNKAANVAAKTGFDGKVFSQPSIHKLCYASLRTEFGLTAQLAVRAIGKAVECFKRDKKKCPKFRDRSAIVYDQRIMSFKGLTHVSLASVDGRLLIPMVIAGYQSSKLQAAIKVGQADLVYIKGVFYLLLSAKFEDTPKIETSGILGVDLGVAKIAVDSEGNTYTGDAVEAKRVWAQGRRDILQSVGTKSAKRRLKRLSGHEANFRRTTNHQVARKIVDTAKARNFSISIEYLSGIRRRARFRKSQRAKMSAWSFLQLRSFIEYKAAIEGLSVVVVDPRNTSRTCSVCGHCEKANRKSQAKFECLKCGHSENADANAAKNIRTRGHVSGPMVGIVDGKDALHNCA